MPRREVTLLLAGLVLLAGLAFLLQGEDAAEPPGGPPVAATEAPPATPAQAPLVGEPTAGRSLSADAAQGWITEWLSPTPPAAGELRGSRGATVRGRLTVRQRPWEHPVGIEIRVTQGWLDTVQPIPTDNTATNPANDDARVRTDENGRFAVRILPGRGEWFFLIGQGTDWQDFQKIPKLPRAGSELDLGDVMVDARGGIRGRIVDEHGQPVGNAVVRAVDDPLLSGNAGLESLQSARVAELQHFRTPGAMRAGVVPDWVVRRDRLLPFPRIATDAEGNFHLRGVRPGSHDLFVQDREGLGSGSVRGVLVACDRATEIGSVRMHMGNTWEVRCVDELERPWVGAAIALIDRNTGFGNEPQSTDAEGRARLRLLSEDPVVLFQHPDGGPWLPATEEASIPGTLLVRRPLPLTIRVVDDRGRPLPAATVRTYYSATLFRTLDRAMPNSMQPREKAPGEHRGTCATDVRVVASLTGFAPAITSARPDTLVELTMLPLQSMTVHTEDLQGRAIADAAVRVKVEQNRQLQFRGAQWGALADNTAFLGYTDRNGDLTVPVWPAEFSFQASHPNYAASAGPRLIPQPGMRQRLLLRGGADVVGRLTLQQRPAPKGLRVRARQRPPVGSEIATSGWLQQEVAVTGDQGAFEFRGLCAGDWVLEPEWPTLPAQGESQRPPNRFRSLEIALYDGQERHCVLEAESEAMEPANVVGSVLQNGSFLVGAVVRVRELGNAPGAISDTAREPAPRGRRTRRDRRGSAPSLARGEAPWLQRCDVDVYGEYRIGGLSAGQEYELRVDIERGGRLQFLARSVVRAGNSHQPTRADFTNAAGSLQLHCAGPDGPFANRMLRLRQFGQSGEGARFEVLLDANGAAFVDAMPAGDWTVEPVHGGQCEPALLPLRAAEAAAHFIRIVNPDR